MSQPAASSRASGSEAQKEGASKSANTAPEAPEARKAQEAEEAVDALAMAINDSEKERDPGLAGSLSLAALPVGAAAGALYFVFRYRRDEKNL